MRFRPAAPDDLPLLGELFRQSNETQLDLAAVTGEKCFGAGLAAAPSTLVAEEASGLAGAVTICGPAIRILSVRRDARGRGIGSKLLAWAESEIAARRFHTAILGFEPGNYFVPGVPESIDPAFFVKRGFTMRSTAVNLTVDLAHLAPAEDAGRARAEDAEAVIAFVRESFGDAWAFECARAFENDPPTLFIARADGGIAGFSAHEANNRGLGSYGPAGIAPAHRGSGLGRVLLLASLADLRRLGYRRAIIPWAASVGFYERSCGASVAQRYLQMAKELAANGRP